MYHWNPARGSVHFIRQLNQHAHSFTFHISPFFHSLTSHISSLHPSVNLNVFRSFPHASKPTFPRYCSSKQSPLYLPQLSPLMVLKICHSNPSAIARPERLRGHFSPSWCIHHKLSPRGQIHLKVGTLNEDGVTWKRYCLFCRLRSFK